MIPGAGFDSNKLIVFVLTNFDLNTLFAHDFDMTKRNIMKLAIWTHFPRKLAIWTQNTSGSVMYEYNIIILRNMGDVMLIC